MMTSRVPARAELGFIAGMLVLVVAMQLPVEAESDDD
jgi:hypothetical protein